ncbi:hypothetical protein [Dyadobacter diqingensis]|uniref:hypothetical protein n=1 Tax=Dyadobacter diqingensis TaxID=2938121 RepID=UPI0020C1925A|nr:hypothetical protein [Dyadobacter diqingensis]
MKIFVSACVCFAISWQVALCSNKLVLPDSFQYTANRLYNLNAYPDDTVKKPDKAIKRFLGEEAYKLMVTSDSVQAYILDPMAKGEALFHGYAIFDKPKKLSKEEVEEVRAILSNQSNYGFDRIRKSCAFMPVIGLQFGSRTKLTVLISMACDEWSFVYKGVKKKEDCDKARPQLVKFIKTIFPGDKAFETLN